MKQQEKLSGALQENILTLLVFSDHYAKLIRHSITANLFESAVFREIAEQAIDFIDQFQEPIKEHLPDSLEGILLGSDKRKATSYTRVIDNLFLSKDSINGDYTISQLSQFVRQQNLKSALVKAVEAIEDGNVAGAEVELQKGLSSQIISFDPGLNLRDADQALDFFNQQEHGILTGITELDQRDITPRPGELFLVIAPPKKGKSWALIHFGKWGLLQRKKVLHITLEMAQSRVSQRYIQNLYSISKRSPKVNTTTLVVENGKLVGLDIDEVERKTLLDANIKPYLKSRIEREFRRRPPLIIKQFPTGALTISMLRAYLDGLERFHKFIPDMIILDYPDLMELDGSNLRTDTGKIYKDLRGIAMERNCAMVVASQGNRASSKAKVLTDDMVAEDYSKIATADNVLTYAQTHQEKTLNLARLFVSNGRNDEDKFQILISQAYSIGQFCLNDCYLGSEYWRTLDEKTGARRDRDDD